MRVFLKQFDTAHHWIHMCISTLKNKLWVEVRFPNLLQQRKPNNTWSLYKDSITENVNTSPVIANHYKYKKFVIICKIVCSFNPHFVKYLYILMFLVVFELFPVSIKNWFCHNVTKLEKTAKRRGNCTSLLISGRILQVLSKCDI